MCITPYADQASVLQSKINVFSILLAYGKAAGFDTCHVCHLSQFKHHKQKLGYSYQEADQFIQHSPMTLERKNLISPDLPSMIFGIDRSLSRLENRTSSLLTKSLNVTRLVSLAYRYCCWSPESKTTTYELVTNNAEIVPLNHPQWTETMVPLLGMCGHSGRVQVQLHSTRVPLTQLHSTRVPADSASLYTGTR